jgi:hypothetical protein
VTLARPGGSSLRELLARVHERLHHAPSVDAETRRLLTTLTRDIERTLGEAPPASAEQRESLSKLEGFAARFEADHPALAQTLRDVADLLGRGGI